MNGDKEGRWYEDPGLIGDAMGLLHLRQVGFRRDSGWVLRGVSFSMQAGEAWGVIGESGAGKTTLVNAILGLLEPNEGEILLEGLPWSGVPERLRRSRRPVVQALLQDAPASLPPHLKGWEILEEPLRIHGHGDAVARRERILAAAEQVKLPVQALEQRPSQWSGGLAQRVALARALVLQPKLLVLDEPWASLDPTLAQHLMSLLMELKATGVALLVVSHDLAAVSHLCDSCLVFYGGEVLCRGAMPDLIEGQRHPYFRGLWEALPALDRSTPPARWGAVRIREASPGACLLYERCPRATELCTTAPPMDLAERCHHLG